MNPRFINNLPVEIFLSGKLGFKSRRSIESKTVQLTLYLQGFAENFILQMAAVEAL
jgi:hypothetical protein